MCAFFPSSSSYFILIFSFWIWSLWLETMVLLLDWLNICFSCLFCMDVFFGLWNRFSFHSIYIQAKMWLWSLFLTLSFCFALSLAIKEKIVNVYRVALEKHLNQNDELIPMKWINDSNDWLFFFLYSPSSILFLCCLLLLLLLF